jgi:uncharacterized lipoprotein YehR (DUF1307 family)
MRHNKSLFLLMFMFSLIFVLAGCGGGDGGSDGGSVNTSCVDVSGTWHTTWISDPTACGEMIAEESMNHVITQSGCNITVSDVKGTFNGTVNGNSLTWTGSYPDDGGTTTSTINLTFSSNALTGSGTWTWTNGAQSCSGTTTNIQGTKVL